MSRRFQFHGKVLLKTTVTGVKNYYKLLAKAILVARIRLCEIDTLKNVSLTNGRSVVYVANVFFFQF